MRHFGYPQQIHDAKRVGCQIIDGPLGLTCCPLIQVRVGIAEYARLNPDL